MNILVIRTETLTGGRMTERLSERERIIEQLNNKFMWLMDAKTREQVADWHLAEVKRIVEPLVKYKKEWEISDQITEVYGKWGGYNFHKYIEETLKRAGGE